MAMPNGFPLELGTEMERVEGKRFAIAAAMLHPGAVRAAAGAWPPLLPVPPVPLDPLPPVVSANAAAPPPMSTASAASTASGDFHQGRVRLAWASCPPD